METLKNEEVQVTPGLTFTYRKADIQGLTDPVHTAAAALGAVAGATTVTTAVRLIQTSPSASIAGIQLIPLQTLEALLHQQQQQQQHHQVLQGCAAKEHKVKGRMTPYAFFVQERREQYRRQGLEVHFTLFSKECSALWKGMSFNEKQRYHLLAEEDRDRYQKEMVGITCAKPLAKDGSRRGRKKKEPGQPKRNMCAFLHFCSEKRPKLKEDNPTATVGGMAKLLSSTWKEMSIEQRRPYEHLAERDKERYEQQKQAYEAGYLAAMSKREFASPMQPAGILLPHQMILKPPRQKRRRKDPDMPKRNMDAESGEETQDKAANPDFGLAKLSKALSVEWLNMNEESKRPYIAIALRDKERYSSELKAYKTGSYVRSDSAHSLPVTPTCSEPHHSGTEEKEQEDVGSILDLDPEDNDDEDDDEEEEDEGEEEEDEEEEGGNAVKKAAVCLSPGPSDVQMYQQLRELYHQ
eukprot:Em0022g523a